MQNLKQAFIQSLKALSLSKESLDLKQAIRVLENAQIKEGKEKEIARFIWQLALKYPQILDPQNKKLITFCKSITASSLGLTQDKEVKPPLKSSKNL